MKRTEGYRRFLGWLKEDRPADVTRDRESLKKTVNKGPGIPAYERPS